VVDTEPLTRDVADVPARRPATGAVTDVASRPERVSRKAMVAAVLLFVLVGHIWGIQTGLYLDDHAHFEHLRHGDWSFGSAVEASRLGIVGQVIDLWGRREAGLLFFRPVAFWIMKAQYTLAGWDPLVMHVFSLGWHTACALLTGALAMWCLGRRSWATVAACLMAIHPNHVATVYWIACQTELLATAFLLVGTLAYARHAGWPHRMFLRDADAPRCIPDSARRAITPAAVLAILCYALALGCRENAVLFPLVCLAGDRLCGTVRRRRVRIEHAVMGGVLVGYFALRWVALGGLPLPPKPYLMPVTDPEFPQFLLHKISIYLTALFFYVPIVPIGGRVFFSTRPAWLYGGLALVLLLLALIAWAYRFRRSLAWPLVWMACFLAPVLPVFASSHHLYLPSVGWGLLVTAGLAALAGHTRTAARRSSRVGLAACGVIVGLHALALPMMSWSMGFTYTRGTLVEDLLIRDVVTRGRPLRNGDHLFFVNMPILAYYAVPAIKERLGLTELYGHALTFAPDLIHMSAPGYIEQLDGYTLRVRAPEQERYFEGITGRTLLEVMGLSGRIEENETINAELFEVRPTRVDEQGVAQIEFSFRQPLASPEFHFFFGSPRFMAYPLVMDPPADPAAPSELKRIPQQ